MEPVRETLLPSRPGVPMGWGPPSPPNRLPWPGHPGQGRRAGRMESSPPPRSKRGDPRTGDGTLGEPLCLSGPGCGPGFRAACRTPAARPRWKPLQVPVLRVTSSWSRSRRRPQPAQPAEGWAAAPALPLPGPHITAALSCLTLLLLSLLLVPVLPVTDDLPERLQGHSSPIPAGRCGADPGPSLPPAPRWGGRRGGCSSVPRTQQDPCPRICSQPPATLPAPGRTPGSRTLMGRGCPGRTARVGGRDGGHLLHAGAGGGLAPSVPPPQISAGPGGAEHPSS